MNFLLNPIKSESCIDFNTYIFQNFLGCYIDKNSLNSVDYKKKSLSKINRTESYEEIDTRLASGWYVETAGNDKKKKYKTKEVSFTVSKKQKK